MDLPFGAPLVIANPSAGARRSPVLDQVVHEFRSRGVEPDVVLSAGVGDLEDIASDATAEGRGYLVAVGGDGTVQHVVNGVIDAEDALGGHDVRQRPVLGVVGAGSGSDLMRTFGLDRRPDILIDHLLSDDVQLLDLVRIRCRGIDGRPVVRLGANVAEVGYGASVVRMAARLPRRLGVHRYSAAILAAATSFRRVSTTVRVDGGEVTESMCNVVIANGQFFGGGLHVSPRALPGDGQLDVQSWSVRPVEMLTARQQLRHGDHLDRPDVRAWRSRHVFVDAESPLTVEADGEVIGSTPVTFDVVPGALRLKV